MHTEQQQQQRQTTPAIYTTINDVRRIQPDDTSDSNFVVEMMSTSPK